MAFFDDRRFLLSHIRHSFITSDPTETCERVMLHETMPHYFGSDAESAILKGKFSFNFFSAYLWMSPVIFHPSFCVCECGNGQTVSLIMIL